MDSSSSSAASLKKPKYASLSGTDASIQIRHLGQTDFVEVFQSMQDFTFARTASEQRPAIADEIWITEHAPVFTQGQAGRAEHLLRPGDIPVVQCDRGGQVTYHGPGQAVVYLLVDLPRAGLGIRSLVNLIQDSIIEVLDGYAIKAACRQGAPGVYAGEEKIASLGLRIRKGCSYHGLSLNVNMDLEPFSRIHPCGITGLRMTHMNALTAPCPSLDRVSREVAATCAAGIEATSACA